MKAVKFGGTSMSTADSILSVKQIIESDAERRFIVVSAPGKANGEDKVTDMLVAVAGERPNLRAGKFAPVCARFEKICDGVGLGASFLKEDLSAIEKMLQDASRDYIVSRGEYLCAKILAALLGYEFVDAAKLIKFSGNTYDDGYTESVCALGLSRCRAAVIPGFYGSNGNGDIVTFSRGGSDISGAIVARAVGAGLYENFTDVDGFMTCDPRTVPHASVIDILTYNELRELAYMGANVLHPESIFPVRKANIPIHILNTFNPSASGTKIVPTEEFLSGKYERTKKMPITAIAGRQHFFSLHIDKSMMNSEVGFVRRVLSCFERLGIAIEHIPSGIDSMTVVFSAVDQKTVNALIKAVQDEVKPDHISLTTDVALIAIVGHGMKSRPGTAARAINRLSTAGINLRMIDQGASEINIILGVSDDDFERALVALNGEFEV
ncbi:MAG: aspartate kinase [Clostridiales bacterium]|nr:aspartate kinase [Clostridiales bacterium]